MRILHLMLLVALAGADMGLGLAVARASEELALLGLFLLTMALFCTATLGATLRRGRERAAWLGLAVFGWPMTLFALLLLLDGGIQLVLGGLVVAQVFGLIGGGIGRAMAPRDG